MRIPLSWLGEFVSWNGPLPALVDRLVMGGLKVEAVEEVGRVHPDVRVGRMTAVTPHPDAERLRVCRVDVGEHQAVGPLEHLPHRRRPARVRRGVAGVEAGHRPLPPVRGRHLCEGQCERLLAGARLARGDGAHAEVVAEELEGGRGLPEEHVPEPDGLGLLAHDADEPQRVAPLELLTAAVPVPVAISIVVITY